MRRHDHSPITGQQLVGSEEARFRAGLGPPPKLHADFPRAAFTKIGDAKRQEEVFSRATEQACISESTSKADLTVTLTGIRNDQGQVFIQLWTAPEGIPKQADKAYKFVAIEACKAVNRVVTATFSDLAPGTYAVSAPHDDGKMDTNAFGIPKERGPLPITW